MNEPLCHVGIISSGHAKIALEMNDAQHADVYYSPATDGYRMASTAGIDASAAANTHLELQHTPGRQQMCQVQKILLHLLKLDVRDEVTYEGALARATRATERMMASVTSASQCVCVTISSALFASQEEEIFFLEQLGSHIEWPHSVVYAVHGAGTTEYARWGLVVHDYAHDVGILYLCPIHPALA